MPSSNLFYRVSYKTSESIGNIDINDYNDFTDLQSAKDFANNLDTNNNSNIVILRLRCYNF